MILAGMLADLVGKEVEVWLPSDTEPSVGGTLENVFVISTPDHIEEEGEPGHGYSIKRIDGTPADLAPVACIELLDGRGLRCRVVGEHIAVVCWRADS